MKLWSLNTDYERGKIWTHAVLEHGQDYPFKHPKDYYQGYGTIILADRIVADHLRTGFKLA